MHGVGMCLCACKAQTLMGFAIAPALWSNLGAVASWSITLNFAAPSHNILFLLSSPPGTLQPGYNMHNKMLH
jgi:hypothetical protein